jgi:hypothetical protein
MKGTAKHDGTEVKLPAHRAGLPGNVDMITGSAFLPVLQQEGGASSRLARDHWMFGVLRPLCPRTLESLNP